MSVIDLELFIYLHTLLYTLCRQTKWYNGKKSIRGIPMGEKTFLSGEVLIVIDASKYL